MEGAQSSLLLLVVFETVGDPSGFDRAIKKLKTQHPEIEWLMELSDECSADEDFFAINDHGVREDDKAIGIKLFGIMTNLQALRQKSQPFRWPERSSPVLSAVCWQLLLAQRLLSRVGSSLPNCPL